MTLDIEEAKRKKSPIFMCIPGGLLLGMGIGWIYGYLVQGLLIGLGAGFLIVGILAIFGN